MDIKKIVLAVALMMGMAAVPAQVRAGKLAVGLGVVGAALKHLVWLTGAYSCVSVAAMGSIFTAKSFLGGGHMKLMGLCEDQGEPEIVIYPRRVFETGILGAITGAAAYGTYVCGLSVLAKM